MYKLVISDDEGKATIVPLVRNEMTIGREEGNTIRLTERNVSRFHANIMHKDGGFVVQDLSSLCGTKVNNKLLMGESAPIAVGDQIVIGDYTVSIRVGPSASIQAEPHLEPEDEEVGGKVTTHARLVLLTEPEPGREIDLEGELYVLGRSSESNCQIAHSSVSRAHARLDYDEGEWLISDLESINGVLINGVEKDNYELKAGDVVELGSVRLRFVAPGEPFDFDPDGGEDSVVYKGGLRQGLHRKVLLGLGLVGIVAAITVVVVVLLINRGNEAENQVDTAEQGADATQPYDMLIALGKEKMNTEQWLEAARIFAVVLQKHSDSAEARDLKQLAITESIAQQAFTDGLDAEVKEKWKEAFEALSSISPSSHYYDAQQLAKVSGKLCQELLDRAKAAAEEEDLAKVMVILEEIDNIKAMPADCKSNVDKLWEEIEKNETDDGALVSEIKTGKSVPKAKKRPGRRKARKAPADSHVLDDNLPDQ